MQGTAVERACLGPRSSTIRVDSEHRTEGKVAKGFELIEGPDDVSPPVLKRSRS